MDLYRGAAGDKPRGGGAFVEEKGFGHEVFNFLPDENGVYRGYVRPPNSGSVANQRINIQRLGASAEAGRLQGVDVFWVATDPVLGGTKVVGWYEDATVYRGWKPSPQKRTLPNGEDAGFMIEAKVARLVPKDDRVFVVPRATKVQAGIGQANLWYVPDDWAQKLRDYRDRGSKASTEKPKTSKPQLARSSDTEARLRIEREAMLATIAWCEERGLSCTDVSLQYRGWDLEAGSGKNVLRIEVKRSSRPIGEALLELTPNEFSKMSEHRDSFRVSVVSLAAPEPNVVMFYWSNEVGAWIADAGGYTLKLHEVVSARVEVRSTQLQ
jgi:hypothetical protein